MPNAKQNIKLILPWESARDIDTALEILAFANGCYGRPPLDPFDSRLGLRYAREPLPGLEQWQTWPILYRTGLGDCKDLAGALAHYAGGRAFKYRAGPALWHVVTEMPDRSIVDPSRVLGMLDGR